MCSYTILSKLKSIDSPVEINASVEKSQNNSAAVYSRGLCRSVRLKPAIDPLPFWLVSKIINQPTGVGTTKRSLTFHIFAITTVFLIPSDLLLPGFPLKLVQAFKFLFSTRVVLERKNYKFKKLNRFFKKKSFIMLLCQFVWATKTIALGTCLVVDTCFMISASRPGKQVVRANRVMKSAHNAESPSGSSSLSISRGGRSHARILRPSSSHKLDIILIALELPVSIYFEAVIQLRVRRFHLNPPHLFTFYLTHAQTSDKLL